MARESGKHVHQSHAFFERQVSPSVHSGTWRGRNAGTRSQAIAAARGQRQRQDDHSANDSDALAILGRLAGTEGARRCIATDDLEYARNTDHYLATADLAAIEIVGLPIGRSLWIGVGRNPAEWSALHEQFPDASFAGLILRGQFWQIELPADEMLPHRYRALAGAEEFPNVVYFPPVGRAIDVPTGRGEIIDTTRFRWNATYDPRVSLDSILLTVNALSTKRFEECLRLVNLALAHQGKEIVGFGRNGRLVVKGTTNTGIAFQHAIEELSSGEQQMLLLVGYVVAFLGQGGIVLLDEPDLHIHSPMIKQLLQTIDYIVGERNGQLLVASHSDLVGDFFSRDEENVNLSALAEISS